MIVLFLETLYFVIKATYIIIITIIDIHLQYVNSFIEIFSIHSQKTATGRISYFDLQISMNAEVTFLSNAHSKNVHLNA